METPSSVKNSCNFIHYSYAFVSFFSTKLTFNAKYIKHDFLQNAQKLYDTLSHAVVIAVNLLTAQKNTVAPIRACLPTPFTNVILRDWDIYLVSVETDDTLDCKP